MMFGFFEKISFRINFEQKISIKISAFFKLIEKTSQKFFVFFILKQGLSLVS